MIEVHALAGDPEAGAALSVTLSYDQRRRTRLRARTDSGEPLAVILPRGTVLRHGDVLEARSGQRIAVRAAAEEVSTVRSQDPVLLARACYHLGNRHVALEIGAGWARYLHDHVLDRMVRGLGLEVAVERARFQPESGAYGGHHHDAPGDHDH